MNLRKIFEEEGAETPCDICGDSTHDYRNYTKEAYRESQDVRQDLEVLQDSEGQCPNCDQAHPGICPCAWCDQLGHIAQDCLAHFTDNSMQAKFPKKDRIRKTPIKNKYECPSHCGESHPFNIYCPNVKDPPPIIPGECRSCRTTTKEHANDCQYVAIKDNIGLCMYCRALNHRYADCPQRMADHERSLREKKKNKRNSRKKGRVKIIAGVMMRKQDSDSTLPSEGRGREKEMLSPCRIGGQENLRGLYSTGIPSQPVVAPQETICSFCGVATHEHRDCPLLHQYIREQADALAEMRLSQYRQLQGWVDYESSKPISLKGGPLQRGGGPQKGDAVLRQEPHMQKTSKMAGQTKPGMIGSMYPHLIRGMAPGGGEGPPPTGGRDPPLDKPDDEEGEEEEGEDTNKETVSVTSSSQGSVGRAKYHQWKDTGAGYGSGAGGPPEDPNDLSGEGAVEGIVVDPEAIEVKGEGLDLQVKMGPRDLWDLLVLGDFQEGTDCPPLWDLLPPLD